MSINKLLINRIGGALFFCAGFLSCAEYTPKPRGYFRIEPIRAEYQPFSLTHHPYTFNISAATTIEMPLDKKQTPTWINIVYPELKARIYCDYLPITPYTLPIAVEDSRALVARQIKQAGSVKEKTYSNLENHVYGSLFILNDGDASPIQFTLTDSVSNFFRGALFFDCKPNADSLAPAINYIRKDIIELIQTFRWYN